MRPLKETRQRKCPSCLFTLIPRNPSIANHLFLKGHLHMWPETKGNSLWREKGRKEKKRKRKKALIWTTNASQDSLQQTQVLSLGIPREKKTLHFFPITVSSLLHRPNPAKCKAAAIGSVESSMPCPGNPRVKCCKHRTAQEGSERKWGWG